jgi:hypothetical protein
MQEANPGLTGSSQQIKNEHFSPGESSSLAAPEGSVLNDPRYLSKMREEAWDR